jgi:hypothetical protein
VGHWPPGNEPSPSLRVVTCAPPEKDSRIRLPYQKGQGREWYGRRHGSSRRKGLRRDELKRRVELAPSARNVTHPVLRVRTVDGWACCSSFASATITRGAGGPG